MRENVPLWVGFMGPSGGGKTFSALRLATGIASVAGGDVWYIDTESRRALHYAEHFKFRHVDFKPPYGSLDYLTAAEQCVGRGAHVIVIDSMSHEHEGPGGYLDYHDKEVQRLAGEDKDKAARINMLAWTRPVQARQRMISGLLRLNVHLICCFRAKEKTKPVKGAKGTDIVQMGWMPITGDAIVYEMTVSCLLLPRANGIPAWQTEHIGERAMMKLPEQFRELFKQPKPIDETLGAQLAIWARGGAPVRQPAPAQPTASASGTEDYINEGDKMLACAARAGTRALQAAWSRLSRADQETLKPRLDDIYKPLAEKVTA